MRLQQGVATMNTVKEVIERSVGSLKPYARNARTHSKKQVKQIASSIERFGFVNPVLISDESLANVSSPSKTLNTEMLSMYLRKIGKP